MTNLRTEYETYYSKHYIQYQLTEALKHRELALFGLPKGNTNPENLRGGVTIRNIKAWGSNQLQTNFKDFRVYSKYYKMYYSLAKFSNGTFPYFSPEPTTRKIQQEKFNNELNNEPEKFIESYDLLFDIDENNFVEGHRQATDLLNFLQSYRLPVFINPSGGKTGGFHIRVDFKHFADKINPIDAPGQFINIAKKLKEIAPSIDTSIYSLRRVCKLPYSLVFTDKAWRVILPLTKEEFDNFTFDKCKLQHVYNNNRLSNRGLCEITCNGQTNVKGMFKYLDMEE